MNESSPYEEEQALEDETSEALLALLALAFLFAVEGNGKTSLTLTDLNGTQDRFKRKASESIPTLASAGTQAVQIGVGRTSKELGLNNLSIDYSDSRFSDVIQRAFNSNLELMIETNQAMFSALLEEASRRGWSEAEVARRFKLYFGLTPRYLRTVLAMEDALIKEKVPKSVIAKRVQKRIDQLIEHRIKLAATLISTEVVEGSKDEAFKQLAESGQIDRDKYIKEWRSVIDDSTTQVCLSSHRMIAEIDGVFPNGYSHPPATSPVHPCRSSIRIIKRSTK